MTTPNPNASRLLPVPFVSSKERSERAESLPAPLNALIGRETDIARVEALLQQPRLRLVTLTGPGGVGKTRVAFEVAARRQSRVRGGVTVVELASLTAPAMVGPAVAAAVGVRELRGASIDERLVSALGGRDLLLVLDNFEHVIGAAPLVTHLLKGCPELLVLVTSRKVLRLTGENVVPIRPLTLPAPGPPVSAALAVSTDAVRLFAVRAAAACSDFTLTDDNAADVAEICRRVDGLPLAIELAAARLAHLTPEALRERLSQRLPLLTGGPRDLPERQQTMRATINWSYELLSEQERALLRGLAVFVGGCSLEAAEAVESGEGATAAPVLDTLSALVASSLLQRASDAPGQPRYSMLETVREFALVRLREAEEAEQAQSRHTAYFVDLASRPKITYWVPKETLEDHANIRAALAWAITRDHAELIVPLGIAVWQFLEPATDSALIEQAVAAASSVPARSRDKRVLLLAAAAQYAQLRTDTIGALELVEACHAHVGPDDASPEIALALLVLAIVMLGLEDLDRCEALADESRRMWRTLDEPGWVGEALYVKGYASYLKGDFKRADPLLYEAVRLARAHGAEPALATALGQLGAVTLELGDHTRAASYLRESVEVTGQGRDPVVLESNITYVFALAAATGYAEKAARLFGACTAWKERVGMSSPTLDRAWQERAENRARSQLGDMAFASAFLAGRALTLNQAMEIALEVCLTIQDDPPSAETHASRSIPAADHGLTPREFDVLRLLADGASNRRIGEELFISPETVRRHATNLYSKLGVTSRTEAVTFAHRHGLV